VDETALADLRLNGVPVPSGAEAIPRLPIVEAPPVTVDPLAPGSETSYRHRLLAEFDRAAGVRAYVVVFEPLAKGLPRGRAWIAEDDFGLVRLDAMRSGLAGPIVSSRRSDEYRRVEVEDGTAWLPERLALSEAYEAAGHRTPVERVTTLRSHEVDPPSFDARRRAAHASPSVLIAAVDGRLQYLRRERPASDAPPLRAAAGRATRLWTLAAGVLDDPGIDGVLPYAGVGYADLDLLGTGTQLSAFAAGPFVQLAWSGTTGRVGLRAKAFASLVEYNDRSFRGGVERYDENVRQRPATASLEAVKAAGRVRLRAAYEVARPSLRRGPDTAAAFVTPASPIVHGLRVGADGEIGPWMVGAWASAARRSTWSAWGRGEEAADDARAYERAGVDVARSFVLGRRLTARVDAAAMAGRGLDRFSRFSFDGLENRVHGAPLASIRFDRGLVLRSALSASLARGVRADLFADAALVRDPTLGEGARAFPGCGAALQAALPGATSLAVEWGYGPRSRDAGGRAGAHVWRLTAYKIL
jgi:hypothetical protein